MAATVACVGAVPTLSVAEALVAETFTTDPSPAIVGRENPKSPVRSADTPVVAS